MTIIFYEVVKKLRLSSVHVYNKPNKIATYSNIALFENEINFFNYELKKAQEKQTFLNYKIKGILEEKTHR